MLGGHVASLVELRWTLGPNDTPGRASLAGITFPPSTHDLITMAPIHWGKTHTALLSVVIYVECGVLGVVCCVCSVVCGV